MTKLGKVLLICVAVVCLFPLAYWLKFEAPLSDSKRLAVIEKRLDACSCP